MGGFIYRNRLNFRKGHRLLLVAITDILTLLQGEPQAKDSVIKKVLY